MAQISVLLKTGCLLAVLAGHAVFCQEFEVVSIKPNTSGRNGNDSNSNQSEFRADNLSLKGLIATGYGLKDYQIEGPNWLDSQRFDIAAKFPEALSKNPEKREEELRAMVRNMLAGRFGLTSHQETRTFTVYGLTVAGKGIRFKESPPCDSHNSNGRATHYTATCIPMETFAGYLTRRRSDLPADLQVLDMTGLKGHYDITLDWIQPPRPENKDDPGAAAEEKGALLLDAMQQQLGLKLETRKAPIEVMVVDHLEKVPSEN